MTLVGEEELALELERPGHVTLEVNVGWKPKRTL